jgi:hypothetical protein
MPSNLRIRSATALRCSSLIARLRLPTALTASDGGLVAFVDWHAHLCPPGERGSKRAIPPCATRISSRKRRRRSTVIVIGYVPTGCSFSHAEIVPV